MESIENDKLIWRRCKQKRATEHTYDRHVTELQMNIATIGTNITLLIAFLLARETKYGTQAAYKNSRVKGAGFIYIVFLIEVIVLRGSFV
jgi:hypothetical protein